MRSHAPFRLGDLDELDGLLGEALAVVPMTAVAAGQQWPQVIGLRHDVDNAIEPAVAMARWEEERGYRSTYFILHTAPYWDDKQLLRRSLDRIAEAGHEIGIHNNALAQAWDDGGDPAAILEAAIVELRGYGHDIAGTVAHGDQRCYDARGMIRFVNDELFEECPRPDYGPAVRQHGKLLIDPVPLSDLGLLYDANWLPRAGYASDSGGRWRPGFDEVVAGYPPGDGQLHLLVHPDWWGEALQVAA